MDQTWTAALCLLLALLSGANSVTLLIGRLGGSLYFYDTETRASNILVSDSYVSSVDYHFSKGYIYYSDYLKGVTRISMSHNSKDVLEIARRNYVYGVAVDWVNNNLYWTNSKDITLVKSDLDGKNKTTLITRAKLNELKGLPVLANDFYGIEVDPFERTLFMISGNDWGYNGTLMKSDLEGRNIKLIPHDKYKFTSYFTIDRPEKKLYVAARDYHVVYSCNYNGELIQEFSVCQNIGWIVPLAVYRQNVYMSDKSESNNRLLVETLPTMKCPSKPIASDSFGSYGTIYSTKVYDADIQQSLNVYNSYQRIKQRFSTNWDKCLLHSTEWERFDCLERTSVGNVDKNNTEKVPSSHAHISDEMFRSGIKET